MTGGGKGFRLIAGWAAGGMGAFAWMLTELAARLGSRLVAALAVIPTVIGLTALLALTGCAVADIVCNLPGAGTHAGKEKDTEDTDHS